VAGGDLAVLQGNLDEQPVEQRCDEQGELVGIAAGELAAPLALADYRSDGVAPSLVERLAGFGDLFAPQRPGPQLDSEHRVVVARRDADSTSHARRSRALGIRVRSPSSSS
jgi:hypothetical protein